ncbi:MAG: Bax inhibitor-1/YccA family protein, partial [Actinomycetota bacterium]
GSTGTWAPPVTDGPVSPWVGAARMTASGAVSATLVLMVLLLGAAVFGWSTVSEPAPGQVVFPGWVIAAVLVAFVCAIVSMFKPNLARFLAPVYALVEGAAIGAISHAFNIEYDGIVLQAVGATAGVFVVMLVLYRTGIIRVNDKFRRTVVGATLGLMVFYGIALLFRLFGAEVSFLSNGSLLGIGISLFAAGLAAMNLALDFDFIEQGERNGLPKHMEWYAGLGILVTLVWLYLELLRLFANLRERN